jgi:hypothetical protein
VVEKNLGYSDKIKVFELASVYLKKDGALPAQPLRLGLAVKGIEYLDFKGEVEALQKEMGIKNRQDFEILEFENSVLAAEINFEDWAGQSQKVKTYLPLCSFNSIKEDLTFVVPDSKITYSDIEKIILAIDERILKLEFKDIYKNFLTLAIEYLDREKQISSAETQEIRKKIFDRLEKELKVKLKL